MCTDKLHPYYSVIVSDQIASIDWKCFETLNLAAAWTQEEMGFDIYSLSTLLSLVVNLCWKGWLLVTFTVT